MSKFRSRKSRLISPVVVAIGIAALLGAACDGGSGTMEALPRPSPSQSPIEQARWRVQSYPAVAFDKLTTPERRRFRGQRRRVKALVQEVYGALFLDLRRRDAALRDHFSRRAARAFARTRAGIPAHVADVKTTRRSASIGIEVARARHALANVTVRGRGRLDDDVVRWVHRSQLWLERFRGRWRVVGFEVEQRPPPTRGKEK